jgi:large subunit ribosomal protein L15e
MRKGRPRSGRRPKHLGTVKIKANVSYREVAERRALERYPNLKVLNSYFLYRDGRYAWHEVILVDSNHPAIAKEVS